MRAGPVEGVVFGNEPTRRQRTPGGGDGLHLTPKRDLLLEKTIACGSIVGELSREDQAHGISYHLGALVGQGAGRSHE